MITTVMMTQVPSPIPPKPPPLRQERAGFGVRDLFVGAAAAAVAFAWSIAIYNIGWREGAYVGCRFSWSTVEVVPAVWEHCQRRYDLGR